MFNLHVQQKIYRLETLRKYQAYYGPNTPYQIIAEINQLEIELRHMLQADLTRPTQTPPQFSYPMAQSPPAAQPPKKSKSAAKGQKKKKTAAKPRQKPKVAASKPKPQRKKTTTWGLSEPTVNLIVTVGFTGFVFLLVAILFTAYSIYGPNNQPVAAAPANHHLVSLVPTLRPTFTPTRDPNNPAPAVVEAAAGDTVETGVNDAVLPAPNKVSTEIPTPVPTLTPRPAPLPTDTPTPLPTDTPPPAQPPPPPRPTDTPAPPTPTPAPSFPFVMKEQGNRMFQKTNYHVITIYIAIVSEGNVPVGGLKVVGDHTPTGQHVESGLSDWHWSVTNCLDCDYVKFGNLKFEPGTFSDGVWNIYVADGQGTQLSPAVPFTYSSDPEQWVWDFVIFEKRS